MSTPDYTPPRLDPEMIPSNVGLTDQEIYDLSTTIVESDLRAPDALFCDLALIKDLNLGTYFYQLSTLPRDTANTEYMKIMSHLDIYRHRITRSWHHLIPDLVVPEDRLRKTLQDTATHHHLLMMSPATAFTEGFKNHLTIIRRDREIMMKDSHPLLYINIWPLTHLTTSVQHALSQALATEFSCEVCLVCKDPASITPPFLEDMQEWYLYHTKEYMENTPLREAFSKLKYLQTRVYAASLLYERDIGRTDDEVRQAFLLMKSTMDLLCAFEYIAAPSFSPIPPE